MVEPFPDLGCTEFDSPYPHQNGALLCVSLISVSEWLPKTADKLALSRRGATTLASERRQTGIGPRA
jgi:hypothetical protein